VIQSADLSGIFRVVLSASLTGKLKPHPKVYALVPTTTGVPAREMLFVSSNYWDVAGAALSGYNTCWLNRTMAPAEEFGPTPTVSINSMRELTLGLIHEIGGTLPG
jgi:2-haloacid dehalogenase